VLNLYKKIINKICSVFEYMAVFCIAAMLVVVMIQVVGRYFFQNTPGWSEEMARQFMILFSFIGIAIGVRDKIHISLSVIVDNMGRSPRLIIETAGKVLVLVLGIMMSMNMGPYFTKLKYNRLPGTGMPVGWIYAFPTAVGILIALIAFYQIYDHFKYGTDDEQKQRGKDTKQEAAK